MTGLQLAQYRIDAELGRGGMGIVYRATDTKLDRTVAVKVLPPHALASADDRARFYREAKAAAQLHHPNIATVFQVDEAEVEGSQRPFIAMEFIDGESLSDRVAKGPLKLDEAVSIATQIAEALKAAHAKDIVHRDIKSANVMLTRDGVAKVLDFGLAKTAASTQLTRQGATMGTVAYMSPEQARGEEVDGRTDLYALGTMLYEMVAGRLPFGGDYEQAILYGIMNEDPEPLTAIRTGVSQELERIVFKLLAKERRHRYQSAAGLIADLETVDPHGAGGVTTRTTIRAARTTSRGGAPRWTVGASFAAGVLAIALAWALWPRPEPAPRPLRVLDVKVAADEPIVSVDLSSDGSLLVYATNDLSSDNVFVRDLSTNEVKRLPGSAGARIVALSPDGEEVLVTKQLSIERTAVRSGTPLPVVEAEEGTPRANWGPPGWVIYENLQSLWKVSLETGEASPLVTKPEDGSEGDYDWPELLPDGRTVMATVENADGSVEIGFWDFFSGERLGTMANGGNQPQYVDSGYLVYTVSRAGVTEDVVAVPFDPGTRRAGGALIPVTSSVVLGSLAASRDGTLVFRQGDRVTTDDRSTRPVAGLEVSQFPGVNRVLPVNPARFGDLELSPDETRAVLTIQDIELATGQGGGTDVFVLDLASGTLRQLTFDATGASPTWTTDGDSIAYVDRSGNTQGIIDVMIRAADGSGSPRRLFRTNVGVWDMDISPEGDAVVYVSASDPYGVGGISVRNLETGETIELTERRTMNRRYPEFSPDGTRIAYEQDDQLFIIPADGAGVPYAFSAGISHQPRWSKDGGSIYSVVEDGIFRKSVETTEVFMELGFSFAATHFFDVFSDGQRALLTVPGLGASPGPGQDAIPTDSTESLVFMIDWAGSLRGR